MHLLSTYPLFFMFFLDSPCCFASLQSSTSLSPQFDPNAAPVDPRFTVGQIPGNVRINGLSAYMNIIKIFSNQGQETFNADLPRGPVIIEEPPWNDVAIGYQSVGNARLPRRFLLWGMRYIMEEMITNGFLNTSFILLYDDDPVGTVKFTRIERPNMLLPLNEDGNSNTSNTANITDSDLTVIANYPQGARTIPIDGFFLSIVGAIMELAPKAASSLLRPYSYILPHYSLHLHVMFPLGKTSSRRFTNAYAINGMWQLACFVSNERRFSEVSATLLVNGSPIGREVLDFNSPIMTKNITTDEISQS